MSAGNHTTEASKGAGVFYELHAQPEFLEIGYACAPARIRAALAGEIEFLQGVVRGAGRALEVGCGNGRLLEALRDAAAQWVGVDFLEMYLHSARAQRHLAPNTALVAGSAGHLPLGDTLFDTVVCAQNTLGLLGGQKPSALREAIRVTRPRGRLVFVVYSEFSVVPRAEWYTEMHRRGILGRLDWARSTPELLLTEDGHASECFRRDRLEELFGAAGLTPRIERLGEIYWSIRAEKN